jgi:hypothetical protein
MDNTDLDLGVVLLVVGWWEDRKRHCPCTDHLRDLSRSVMNEVRVCHLQKSVPQSEVVGKIAPVMSIKIFE